MRVAGALRDDLAIPGQGPMVTGFAKFSMDTTGTQFETTRQSAAQNLMHFSVDNLELIVHQ